MRGTNPYGLDYFKKVKIAGEAHRASAMVVLSHFKGHEMFGFGGALKNIGMGCVTSKSKRALHGARGKETIYQSTEAATLDAAKATAGCQISFC